MPLYNNAHIVHLFFLHCIHSYSFLWCTNSMTMPWKRPEKQRIKNREKTESKRDGEAEKQRQGMLTEMGFRIKLHWYFLINYTVAKTQMNMFFFAFYIHNCMNSELCEDMTTAFIFYVDLSDNVRSFVHTYTEYKYNDCSFAGQFSQLNIDTSTSLSSPIEYWLNHNTVIYH